MTAAKTFALWFLDMLPGFLLAEPIVYIIGCIILAFVVKIIFKLIHM